MSGQIKFTTLLSDVRNVRQSLALMESGTRARVVQEIQVTTEAVAARARANVPVSGANSRKAKGRPGPGELRDTIRTAYGLHGLAGYVLAGHGKLARRLKNKRPRKLGPLKLAAFQRQQRRATLKALRELGVYAMVVEYGSPGRGTPASRYINRAKEAEMPGHITRITRALQQSAAAAEQGIAA